MASSSGPGKWQAGVTLAEMLIVVALLALVASIALPTADQANDPVTAAAAAEVAHAIRFAQREAVRTGTWHVAEIDPATQAIRVYRLASNGSGTVAEDNNVMHPVDKQRYHITLAGNGATRAIVASSVFTFGADKTRHIAFSPDGAPLHYIANQVPTAALSADGVVSLQSGAARRTVTVDKTTGRVTL